MSLFITIYRFINKIINKSIRNRIILFFSLLIVAALGFLGVFSYNRSSEILADEVEKSTRNLIDQTVANIDAYFRDIKYTVIYIATNQIVTDRIKDFSSGNWSNSYDEQKKELDLVNGILRVKSNIFDILVVGKDGLRDNANLNQNVSPVYDFFRQKWLTQVLSGNSRQVGFISLHPQDYYSPSASNSVKEGAMTVSAAIMVDPSTIQGDTAFVMCDFELENLNDLFQTLKIQNGGNIFLLDNQGKIIFSSEGSMIGTDINDSEYRIIFKNSVGSFTQEIHTGKELLIYSTIQSCGWKVVATVPMNSIYDKSQKIRIATFRIASVCIILVILLSILISTGISKPLQRLIEYMKHAEEGKLDIKVVRTGYGEVAVLERQFRGMLERINSLIRDVYQTRLKQKEAEYDALQSQINPHFLYNTLQIIKAEAVINNDIKVSQMITSLGYLLRYAVYNKNEMVMLRDEVEYVKNYLYIQSQRFEERIRFELSVEEDTLCCKIPKLILQPVIENSITHGLSERYEAGEIRLSVRLTQGGNEVIIEIYDNGYGIEGEKLGRIMDELDKEGDESSIGLKNVQERIRLKFGSDYGISIDSRPGEYTCVKICIPAVKNAERSDPGA